MPAPQLLELAQKVERKLRLEEEQGTGLAAVFHSLTQVTHSFFCGRRWTSAQVLHNRER